MITLKKALAGGAAIAAAAAAAFYYGYFIRTPQYMLRQLTAAVQNKDVDYYDKHIDSGRLFGRLFDESAEWEFGVQSSDSDKQADPQMKKFFAGVRGIVVPVLEQQARNAVIAGKWSNDLPVSDPSLGRGLQIAGGVSARLGLPALTFRTWKDIRKISDTKAVTQAVVFDTQLEQELPLQLQLENTPDGWKITHANNLDHYLTARQKARQIKLDKLNGPLAEKIRAAVIIEDTGEKKAVFRVQRLPGMPPAAQLEGTFTLTNRGGQDIVSVSGRMSVKDSAHIVRYRNSFEADEIPAGRSVQVHNIWPLDMYVPNQSILAAKSEEPLTGVFTIEYVMFKDGSSICLSDSLPE